MKQITFLWLLESDSIRCAFHQTTQSHIVVRLSCIPPDSTVPHGGQIAVHFTSQHSTTWWSDYRTFHQTTQYHMVVRTSYIPPDNTAPHGDQIESLWGKRRGLQLSAESSVVVSSPLALLLTNARLSSVQFLDQLDRRRDMTDDSAEVVFPGVFCRKPLWAVLAWAWIKSRHPCPYHTQLLFV